jgi:hypothetical protein
LRKDGSNGRGLISALSISNLAPIAKIPRAQIQSREKWWIDPQGAIADIESEAIAEER